MRQVNLETFLRQVRKTKVDSCHLRKVVDKQIRYTIHANIIPLLQIKCGTCHCKVPVYFLIFCVELYWDPIPTVITSSFKGPTVRARWLNY